MINLNRFSLLGKLGVLIYSLTVVNSAKSQIIPDRTTNTSVSNDCQNVCQIDGGKRGGDNLFHSFTEFGIRQGESAYFADPGVTNIFSRITGNNASQIFGTLGVNGDANLFLLNPNGILFGEGAILDLNGSFLATTADEIQFGDNGSFAAIPNTQEDLALLTVNPNALFFNQMGQNGAIAVDDTLLSLSETETITLLGKQTTENTPGINLAGAEIIIPQGNINLGSLEGNGKVDIKPNGQLEFPTVLTKGDISLSQKSSLDVSGAGAGKVSLQGKDINISGESQIFANTLGNISGGAIALNARNITLTENADLASILFGNAEGADIQLTAEEAINLVGIDPDALQRFFGTINSTDPDIELSSTVIFTNNLSGDPASASGDITLQSKNLNLSNSAWILATVNSQGKSGAVKVDLGEDITIDNSGLVSGVDAGGVGDGGNLTVNAQNLHVSTNGTISSSTIGKGSSGDIDLNIADTIQLDRSLPNKTFPTIITTTTVNGEGAGGNIDVNADKLIIRDGAEISSGSGGFTVETGFINRGGQGGDITVNVNDLIQVEGVSPENRFPSGIVNRTLSNNPAGDIEVNTGKLEIEGQGVISASSLFEFDTAAGGDLAINATEYIHLSGTGLGNLEQYADQGLGGDIELQNLTGGLLTNTVAGEAGNTQINTPSLVLTEGALISTSTIGTADGGNLSISADNIEVFSSLVASSTIGNGSAGNIAIDTERLTLDRNGLISTSSGGLGNGGNLQIDATDSIELLSSAESLIIPGGLVTTSIGLSYPGNLEINTKDLIIRQGASVGVNSQTDNPLVQELIKNTEIPEELINSQPPRYGIINAESIDVAGFASENIVSSISSTTTSAFPASNIEINTSELSISDRAEISVSSIGKGRAGNLTISANNISLSNGGNFNATTLSGQGGNIQLQAGDLLILKDRAAIKTDASGMGNGGNINIDSNFTIALETSLISANAETGQGGNINIAATDVFLSLDSEITASATAAVGIDGEVKIRTFNTSDRNSIVRLPETTLKTDETMVSSCGDRNQDGAFAYTGKGGLPSNPLTEYSMGDRNLIPDLANFAELTVNNKSEIDRAELNVPPKTLVEARSWKTNNRGKIELVAGETNNPFSFTACPFSSNNSSDKI